MTIEENPILPERKRDARRLLSVIGLADSGLDSFREPWEAQVFVMVLLLHEAGIFSWSEWAATVSRKIAATNSADGEAGDYGRWLAALESLVIEKGVASAEALEARKAAWRRAAEATPDGRPIMLADDPETPAR
jgi:nitrile hydratase accessory protein